MITLSILLGVLLAIAIALVAVTLVFGTGFIVVFGDIFVAAIVIGLVVKLFRRKKK